MFGIPTEYNDRHLKKAGKYNSQDEHTVPNKKAYNNNNKRFTGYLNPQDILDCNNFWR